MNEAATEYVAALCLMRQGGLEPHEAKRFFAASTNDASFLRQNYSGAFPPFRLFLLPLDLIFQQCPWERPALPPA
jgi:hypothetical protein